MSGTSLPIGQHLFVGLAGAELTAANRRLLSTVQPGGIVLFARNCESETQLREFGRAITRELPFRPLIAIDQENGRVNRLRNLVGELPTIPQLKQSGATGPVREFGRTIGRLLRRLEIDVNFAPVVDLELFGEKTDNALRERCWGRTAGEVIRWAGAFLQAMEGEGVAACPKHFPGLGGATVDSHEELPTIHRSREQILREDVQPYARWIGRLSMIMVSHGHYPALDPGAPRLPASLSSNVMTKLLRQQLGYEGLILTDDMEMGAIAKYGAVGDAVVEAFGAGADMMLICHTAEEALAAHEALVQAVEQGKTAARRLRESSERIARFRAKWMERGDHGGQRQTGCLSHQAMTWAERLNARIVRCRQCPRIVEHRERVASEKKREFREWDYWGRPVPSLGGPHARLLIVGLAPAAHGANRTGRMFTGDSSGRWLFRALHKAGFANQPTWQRPDDGLNLIDCYITAVCHCAPPDNKPLPVEIENCSGYLREELRRLTQCEVVIALGKIAFDSYLKSLKRSGASLPKPLPKFAHNVLCELGHGLPVLIASYHPSRQNTHTGKLTEPMFDAVFDRAREILQ